MNAHWLPESESMRAETHEAIERVFEFGRVGVQAAACTCDCGCGGATYDETTGFYAVSGNRSARGVIAASEGAGSVAWWN